LGLFKTSTGPEFNIVDVRDPVHPSWVGGYKVGSDVNAMIVRDGLAYLAHPVPVDVSLPQEQLTVINVSVAATPVRKSGFNYNGALSNGKSIVVVGNPNTSGYTLYLGRTASNLSGAADAVPEFFALDATDPAAIPASYLGALPLANSGDSINGSIVRDFLGFLLTNSKLFIGHIDNPAGISQPWPIATFTLPASGGQTPSMDCESNYLYIASNDSADKGQISIITGP
jgi:hypothetical protein